MSRFALVPIALLASAPVAARAEQLPPPHGTFEFMAGTYRPNVDSEFGGSGPFQAVFGGGREWLFRGGWERVLLTGYGSLSAGIQLGWWRQNGYGLLASGAPSGDRTTFFIIPTSATLTYRFDLLADRYGIPLAPYGRLAFDRYNWWVTNGSGKTVKTGATNGYSFAGGLALLLDFFDPTIAREMWHDSGILHTYVFGEFRKTKVDDFGSTKSWNLSDDQWSISGGLLFVY